MMERENQVIKQFTIFEHMTKHNQKSSMGIQDNIQDKSQNATTHSKQLAIDSDMQS